ncbi:MAG: electron transfer flavoprotein subunit beta/FixA family protein [Candidatus Bathyarchaeota archaeon]|nr:electron transfer flavoprotein subunit beta/FixA family protein [Candidatus Bathyarchaeota archaeon]
MLKIIVCLKQALDVTQLKTDPTTRQIITVNAPKKISDFDKNALEEAVRIKEKYGAEVIVVTVGTEDAKTSLREALAIGADKAYLLCDENFQNSDTLATAYILSEFIKKVGNYDLIFCGEASIDSYSAQVGPRVAEKLNIVPLTYVRKVELEGDTVKVERKLEDCLEVVKAKMPVLITVVREINTPRIPSLMAIMKASKKELTILKAIELQIEKGKVGETGSSIQILEVLAPKIERKRVKIQGENAQEIGEKLAQILIQERIVGG